MADFLLEFLGFFKKTKKQVFYIKKIRFDSPASNVGVRLTW